ncbi:hypothetical protein NMY22_g11671 [Coprinellus aureogranulatus]|nr:hypothetical protein NMY22_g11671 [Coprinellus aureogranulatus]
MAPKRKQKKARASAAPPSSPPAPGPSQEKKARLDLSSPRLEALDLHASATELPMRSIAWLSLKLHSVLSTDAASKEHRAIQGGSRSIEG